MKRRTRYYAPEPPRLVRPAWQRAIELVTWLLLLPLAAALLYLVAGEFGAVPRVPGVPERPTAQVTGPQDAPVAAPAPRYGAEGAGAVSQPAAPATAPLVKPAPKGKAEPTPEPKATPGGKDAQAAPLEVAVAEVVKPTPGGKTTKTREGKVTP